MNFIDQSDHPHWKDEFQIILNWLPGMTFTMFISMCQHLYVSTRDWVYPWFFCCCLLERSTHSDPRMHMITQDFLEVELTHGQCHSGLTLGFIIVIMCISATASHPIWKNSSIASIKACLKAGCFSSIKVMWWLTFWQSHSILKQSMCCRWKHNTWESVLFTCYRQLSTCCFKFSCKWQFLHVVHLVKGTKNQ